MPSGEDHHVGGQGASVREADLDHPSTFRDDARGVLPGVDGEAERLDLAAEDLAPGGIDLHGHQPRRELDQVGLEAHAVERVGGLQSEQAPSNDHAGPGLSRPGPDRLQVLDRAVDEAARRVRAGDGRDKRRGPRGQHQLVVVDGGASRGGHDAIRAIDGDSAIAEVHRDPGLLVEARSDQREIGGGLAAEEAGEVHAVVGEPRLLAERDDVPLVPLPDLQKEFEELVADHPVADHDEVLPRHRRSLVGVSLRMRAERASAMPSLPRCVFPRKARPRARVRPTGSSVRGGRGAVLVGTRAESRRRARA